MPAASELAVWAYLVLSLLRHREGSALILGEMEAQQACGPYLKVTE